MEDEKIGRILVKKDKRTHVQIHREVFEDTRLSWDAKGLYCYLVSLEKPSLELEDLKGKSKSSMENTLKALMELQEHGWLSGGGS